MDGVDLSSIMVQPEPAEQPQLPVERIEEPKNIKKPKTEPEQTELTDEARGATITKLKLYFETFDKKLKHIRPKNLDKLSAEELEKLQSQIHFILGAKTNVEAMAKSFPIALKAIEDLAAQFTPLRIQGTHNVCFEPDVQDMIKYTIIDCGLAGVASTPQQRLAFTLLTAAMRQHTINSMLESMSPEQRQATIAAMARGNAAPENSEADAKFADL